MKKVLTGALFLVAILSFCSCTKTLYTHQQVIQGFHTKFDVDREFGTPDTKKVGVGLEEWTYSRDPVNSANRVTETDTSDRSARPMTHADSLVAATISPYHRYIKFIFDIDGNVVGYKSEGVDLTKKKKIPLGTTILKGLAEVVLVTVVVAAELYLEGDIEF